MIKKRSLANCEHCKLQKIVHQSSLKVESAIPNSQQYTAAFAPPMPFHSPENRGKNVINYNQLAKPNVFIH